MVDTCCDIVMTFAARKILFKALITVYCSITYNLLVMWPSITATFSFLHAVYSDLLCLRFISPWQQAHGSDRKRSRETERKRTHLLIFLVQHLKESRKAVSWLPTRSHTKKFWLAVISRNGICPVAAKEKQTFLFSNSYCQLCVAFTRVFVKAQLCKNHPVI